MWSIFTQNKVNIFNFEDVQQYIVGTQPFFLINTLPINLQKCVILGTMCALKEEKCFNDCLHMNTPVLVYGKHHSDSSVTKKCNELVAFGFTNVNMYAGGLFEWLLLRDVYGDELFPVNTGPLSVVEILDYKHKPN